MLGIIAGGGELPVKLIEACRGQNIKFCVVALENQTDKETIENTEHFWARLGATTFILNKLKSLGVNELVMVGGIKRPSLFEMRPDFRTVKLIFKLGKKWFGDNNLLSAISDELEKDGFKISGVDKFIDNLLAPAGLITKHAPSDIDLKHIETGIKLSQELGVKDIGQAIVIEDGVELASEDINGTDDLIKRCIDLKSKDKNQILVKTCKPQQSLKVDLPTIGINTVNNVINAGFKGIVIQAGKTIMLDKNEIIKEADKAGIFILGFEI